MSKNEVSLRDIYEAVGDLRKEIKDELNRHDTRIQSVEQKTDNLLGKIGVGVMIVSALISSTIAYFFNLLKNPKG